MTLHYVTVNKAATTKLWNLVAEDFNQLIKLQFSTFKTLTAEERDDEKLIVGWEFLPHHKAKLTEYEGGFKAYSRCDENVVAMNVLILDVDNDDRTDNPKITFDEAVEAMDGISCFFYTSFNHLNPNKGEVDRFRIVIELSKPIPFAQWIVAGAPCVAGALQRLFPWAARESFKKSQPFYMPVQAEERKHLSRSKRLNGEALDWEMLDLAPLASNGISKHGEALEIVSLPSLKTKDAETSIRLTDGTQTTVGHLWNSLQDGYAHKKPCFSTIRSEKRASSFAFRDGRFLIMQDFGAKRQRVMYEIEPAPMKGIDDVVAFLNAKKLQRKTN